VEKAEPPPELEGMPRIVVEVERGRLIDSACETEREEVSDWFGGGRSGEEKAGGGESSSKERDP